MRRVTATLLLIIAVLMTAATLGSVDALEQDRRSMDRFFAADYVELVVTSNATEVTIDRSRQCLVNFSMNIDSIAIQADLNGSTIDIPSGQWLEAGSTYVLTLPTEYEQYVFRYVDNAAEREPVYEFTASGPMEIQVNYELSPLETYLPYQFRSTVSSFFTDVLSWGPKIVLGTPIPVTWIVAAAAIILAAVYLKRPYRAPKAKESEYVLSVPDTKRSPWLPPPPPQSPHMEWAQRRFREYLEHEAYGPEAKGEETVIMIEPPPPKNEPPNPNPPEAEVSVDQAPETDDSVIVALPSQPEGPAKPVTVDLMGEGTVWEGVELTTDLLERSSNEGESLDRMRRSVGEGTLRLRLEEPPLLARGEELKDIKKLILGGGHLAILGPSLDKRLIVERALKDLGLGYVMKEAEPQAAEFVRSVLPKGLRRLDPEEALPRLARKGVTHMVVDGAEKMEDASSLLRLAFPASMNVILLSESLPSALNVEAYELKPPSEEDLRWIAFGKAAHRGILLEMEAEQALVNEASREGKPQLIEEAVDRIFDGSVASVQEALRQMKAEERTIIVESLDEGCRRFYEEARSSRALGEEDYLDLFNKSHAGLGMETGRKHYEEAMEKLQRMGFERKPLEALPIENILPLASGKLDGPYLLNEEAVERASEYYASPDPMVEAVMKGALLPRVKRRLAVQRSSRIQPIMQQLDENQSILLTGDAGSGRRTCLEEALKELRIRHLSGDAKSGIATFLRKTLKQLNIEVKASDRGRPTLEDHLDVLHKIKEAGYSYLAAYNVAVRWRGIEAIEKLVRTCFAAKLNVAMTSTKPIEIEGLRIVEHPWSGQTFDWCIFALGLERGLILESEARKLIMRHSSTKENLATAARIIDKVTGGKLGDVEQAIKELKPEHEKETEAEDRLT